MVTQEKDRSERLKNLRERHEKKLREKERRKTRRLIIFAVLVAITVSLALGAVYNASAKEITITEINEFTGLNSSQTVRTRAGSVEDALKERGLDVGEHDKLNIPADMPLNDNDDIVLTRGKRVTIKAGDYENTATVTKVDAADALVEAGYIPGEYDNITTDGDTIELVSVSHTDEAVSETIERGVEYVDDPDLPKGQQYVVDEGEDGVKEIQHKVTYTNGEETARETIGESVTAEPRNKVIARGTASPTQKPQSPSQTFSSSSSVSDSGNTINGYRYKKKITMTATAYSTDPSENAGYSVSAMGNPLGYGIAAVDPSVVPLGSKVYVTAPDGSWTYGVASAEDTGGAIKGNKIDLCYPVNANDFGRRSCVVYVLE